MTSSPNPREAVAELALQLESGALFTHTGLSRLAANVGEAEAFLYGLIDLLVERGLLDRDAVAAAARRTRQELVARDEVPTAGVVLRIDGDENGAAVKIDCEEYLPVCKAVCCKLSFPLSQEEIERGCIRWDLGRPYHNRQRSDGYCVHIDGCQGCGVYDARPTVCRSYDCRQDTRIWKDFDRKILNQEWIDEHLGGPHRPQLMQLSGRRASPPAT